MKYALKFLGSIIIIITLIVSIFNFDEIFHPIYNTLNNDYSTDILESNHSFSSLLINTKSFIESNISSNYNEMLTKHFANIREILQGKNFLNIYFGENEESVDSLISIYDNSRSSFEGWLNWLNYTTRSLFNDISKQAKEGNPILYIANLILNFIPLIYEIIALVSDVMLIVVNYMTYLLSLL